jgi:hypothetical protein
MRRSATVGLALALIASAAPATAQTGPGAEIIGTWRLTCAVDRMTDRADCVLRHRDPVEPASPSQAALTLEVLHRGGRMVPAVTARDLSVEGAARGLLALTGTAQLRFPPNRYFEMPCGLEGRSLVCAPRPADAPRAAEELPAADRVLVRMVGVGTGAGPQTEPVELPLAGTREAIARFLRRAPDPPPPPAPPAAEARDILDRLLRLFGN